jgi:hypothetical protein
MAEPHIPTSLTDTEVAIHTVPLPGEAKVLIFVEANAHVTHILSLAAQAARQLIVGLLDALDVVALDEEDDEQAGRG